jgi:hypothetical protein
MYDGMEGFYCGDCSKSDFFGYEPMKSLGLTKRKKKVWSHPPSHKKAPYTYTPYMI